MAESENDVLREIRTKFVGKWQLIESENFEDLLREMGAPYLVRKMARFAKPDCEITIIDDKVRICMKTAFMTQEDIFEFDQEYEKEFMRMKMKLHNKFEDGRIIHTSVSVDGSKKTAKHIRDIEDGNMILTSEVGDVVAKRIFGRVE